MRSSRLSLQPVFATAALVALLAASAARGGTAWYEGFEGPEPSWQFDAADMRFELLGHDRLQGIACTGKGCERVRIAGAGGTHVDFRHEVGRPRVIDELLATLQVKSDRAGLQLSARIILPRSVDPRTGKALSTIVRGSSYTKVGRWQQLRVQQIPEQLARQVRSLRAELRTDVDPREAFVECLLLNVYGGPGVTSVWIDDLDLAGFVPTTGQWPLADARRPAAGAMGGSSGLVGRHTDSTQGRTGRPWHPVPATQTALGSRAAAAGGAPEPGRVALDGSILVADGRPIFPRVIRHRGEPLELLRRLGFNTVWLGDPPSDAVLAEAKQLGLWLICPPPFALRTDDSDAFGSSPRSIGPQYDVVMAWDLGGGLSGRDLAATRRWADQIRSTDRAEGRPLVCRPESDLKAYSRSADVLLLGRPVSGTSLELTGYGTWLRERPRLTRPGTPIWSTVRTQPSAALLEQWAALAPGEPLPTAISADQIRLVVYTSIMAGSRGLLFESETPLDASDPDTRNRAMILELINLELALAEPWLAAGSYVETIPAAEPDVQAAVLRTDRARLLVPTWSALGAQLVAAPDLDRRSISAYSAAENHVSFVVPGVPEEYRAYLLAAGGMEPLRRSRETGGVRVTLDEFGLTALVLLTQDPLVVNSLTGRANKLAPRGAELRRNLAAAMLQSVAKIHARLAGSPTTSAPQRDPRLAAASQALQWCDGFMAARDYASASMQAERSIRSLRLLERADWQATLSGMSSPVSSPATVSFRTLPWQRGLAEWAASARGSPNALVGGDFEDLAVLRGSGWSHVQLPGTQVVTSAELAPEAARSGRLGLRLVVQPLRAEATETLVETPPAWITTPPVPVESGQLVVIHGWAQVPAPIAGSVDGLLIIDSLTGEPLAERVQQTDGWQEFSLYRVAPRSGAVTVTFALSGLGEAWLDDVTIQRVGPGRTGAPRSPSNASPTRLPPTAAAGWR